LTAVREDLRTLAHLYGVDAPADYKALCLALIDRAATYAADRHGEIPGDVVGHLLRAMHAAGRTDVAAVVEEVEAALVLIARPRSIASTSRRTVEPPPPAGRRGKQRQRMRRRSDRRVGEVAAVGKVIDPLLAKLLATTKK
jgi:hypothetical protein